tara:strand:+ start:401 stop:1069 length:669 start_codon:yes stop_codon:yes gene_type:complete
MTKKSKKEFYKKQGIRYIKNDPEAMIRYENILPWIKLDNKKTIIELGCKYAELKKLLNRRGDKFIYKGIDIDEQTLQNIDDYNSTDFICHDINEGIPIENNSADYIICMEVLEHLENASYFLEEAKRILKKNGNIIISVPNPYSWNEMYRNLLRKKDTEGHIASFTYQNIQSLVQFSGLKIIDEVGSFTRIPFSQKFFGRHILIKADKLFLTRNKIYLIKSN